MATDRTWFDHIAAIPVIGEKSSFQNPCRFDESRPDDWVMGKGRRQTTHVIQPRRWVAINQEKPGSGAGLLKAVQVHRKARVLQ
jgi:hypothetical protein